MCAAKSIVYVVDDDASVREAIDSLGRSVGLYIETYASAQDFLNATRSGAPSCLVSDVRMPGLSGLELQRQLLQANVHLPIIFVTGHADIPMSVRAMKDGAVEFLTKPFRDQELLDAIQNALEHDRKARRERSQLEELQKRFDSLTPRERDVARLVVSGLLNKQIAAELGNSEIMVKAQRAQIMRKTGATSLAELVRMAEKLRVLRPKD